MKVTPKERRILNLMHKVPYVTLNLITHELPEISYPSASKFMVSLVKKEMVLRSPTRYEEGYRYMLPRVSRDLSNMQIPFKGKTYELQDLLLYLSQETETFGEVGDFTKYGRLISAGIYHLAIRAQQIEAGETPNSPSPTEIKAMVSNTMRLYKDLVSFMQTLLDLPIYDLNDNVQQLLPDLPESFLKEREHELFLPSWEHGVASTNGIKDKFPTTLKAMKKSFKDTYQKEEGN